MLSYSIVPLFWLLYYSTPRASKNHMVYCYCVFLGISYSIQKAFLSTLSSPLLQFSLLQALPLMKLTPGWISFLFTSLFQGEAAML